jgi:hypothetical protein
VAPLGRLPAAPRPELRELPELVDEPVVDVLADAGVQTFVAAATDADYLERTDFTVIEASSPVNGDGDGVSDSADNCIYVANPGQQDEDQDGYGTACDPDYNQNGVVTSTDFSVYFLPVYDGTLPYDPKVDHDSDGDVDDRDFLFLLRHFQLGFPGPSALDCAGTVPCPEPCE